MDIVFVGLGVVNVIFHTIYHALRIVVPLVQSFIPYFYEGATLVAAILKVFFKYATPWIVTVLKFSTECLTLTIRFVGALCVGCIENDNVITRLIAVAFIIIAFVYYRYSIRAFRFICEFGRLTALNAEFLFRILKMIVTLILSLCRRRRQTVN